MLMESAREGISLQLSETAISLQRRETRTDSTHQLLAPRAVRRVEHRRPCRGREAERVVVLLARHVERALGRLLEIWRWICGVRGLAVRGNPRGVPKGLVS